MEPAVKLRRASYADWPVLSPLWRAVVAAGDTYFYAPDTPESVAAAFWMPGDPAETWLAEDLNMGVLGTYLLKPNQIGLGDHVANAGFMVDPVVRGRGIGRQLGEHCLARAAELGYRAIQFNAVVANNAIALALWRSLGFVIVGTVPKAFRHHQLGEIDIHIMHRFL
ncbi:GNAT family N-acetyltransferase [Frankia sp. Cj3]|uniref:GNAT family N-acetyltransferase n=1 Tax=Frankia sp. Cj3 TaxID=2880976 RepID=UPI001EF40642|nr:GNAT family N-acetyltransferase [Frankia sp. Cj3]